MTTRAMSERESREPSSSEQSHLEVYLFACGHGDTILVRLPDCRWVLIDCHLPKAGGVRDRFFRFVQEKKIETLALVFQTHPDYDHFLGMRDVLEHFLKKEGHPAIQYVDGGLTPHQIKHLLIVPKRPGQYEYGRLQKSLRDWEKQDRIDRRELDAERPPISPKGFGGYVDFIPIAPDQKARRRLTEKSLEKYARNQNVKFEANELSVVVVLAVNDKGVKTNILLGADAHAEGIQRAKKVAAVSAGNRPGLPDRVVLSDYLRLGWTVMLTTTRNRRTVNRPGELHIKSMARNSFHEDSIRLAWNDAGEFSSGPTEAIVSTRDLTAYETASRAQ